MHCKAYKFLLPLIERRQNAHACKVRTRYRLHHAIVAFFCSLAVFLLCSCSKPNNDGSPVKQVTEVKPTNSNAGQYHGVTNILSFQTKTILGRLEEPLTIRFYVSPYAKEIAPDFVEVIGDLLTEYQRIASGRIVLKQIMLKSGVDFADKAKADGVDVMTVPESGVHCLGIAMQCGTNKAAIPSLNGINVRQLEYHLTRCIQTTVFPSQPVIGLMSTLPLWGGAGASSTSKGSNVAPWYIYSQLTNDYVIRRLDFSIAAISNDISLLILVNPRNLSATTQYSIDQFLMRGGNILAFMDPHSISESYAKTKENRLLPQAPTGLEPLLKAWGLTFSISNAVADRSFLTLTGSSANRQRQPGVLTLNAAAINTNNSLGFSFNNIVLAYAGTFSGTPIKGLHQEILLRSSQDACLENPQLLELMQESYLVNMKSSGISYPLAIRLSGQFPSAFPNGTPAGLPVVSSNHISISQRTAQVLLLADSDLLLDGLCAQLQNLMGRQYLMPHTDNMNFVINCAEQLANNLDIPLLPDLVVAKRWERFHRRGPIKLPAPEALDDITRSVTNLIGMPLEDAENILAAEHQKANNVLFQEAEKSNAEVKARINDIEAAKPLAERGKVNAEQSRIFADFKLSQTNLNEQLKQLRFYHRARIVALERLHGSTNANLDSGDEIDTNRLALAATLFKSLLAGHPVQDNISTAPPAVPLSGWAWLPPAQDTQLILSSLTSNQPVSLEFKGTLVAEGRCTLTSDFAVGAPIPPAGFALTGSLRLESRVGTETALATVDGWDYIYSDASKTKRVGWGLVLTNGNVILPNILFAMAPTNLSAHTHIEVIARGATTTKIRLNAAQQHRLLLWCIPIAAQNETFIGTASLWLDAKFFIFGGNVLNTSTDLSGALNGSSSMISRKGIHYMFVPVVAFQGAKIEQSGEVMQRVSAGWVKSR